VRRKVPAADRAAAVAVVVKAEVAVVKAEVAVAKAEVAVDSAGLRGRPSIRASIL